MGDIVIGEECYGSHLSNPRKRYVRSDDTGRVIVLDETERYTSVAQFFRVCLKQPQLWTMNLKGTCARLQKCTLRQRVEIHE